MFFSNYFCFTYNDTTISPRQDIRNGVYLTGVVVQNDKGEIIKSFTLNYDYFNSPGGIPTIPKFTITNAQSYLYGLDKRLKLLSVKDNLTDGIYKLEYYEDSSLPNRISNDQDFWGVYNGAGNGEKSISLSKYANVNFQSSLIGANKEPNITYGRQGNLRKIYYPTGGHTDIEYEADDFQLLNPEVVNEYGEEEPNPFYNDNAAVPTEIVIPPAALVNKTLYFYTPHTTGSSNVGDCNWTLTNQAGTQVGSGHGPGTFNRSDPAGTYYLKVFQDNGYIVNNLTVNKCSAEYTYTERPIISSETIDTRQAGTIRVSKIQSFDNNNGSIVREYTYKVPNEDGSFINAKSSGVNMGEEAFISLSMNEFPIEMNTQAATAKETMASNNPGWQTTTVRGKSVGYTYVQEHYINGAEPSKSYIKQYTFQNDDPGSYLYYDHTTPVNVSWPIDGLDRGLLKAEILFNSGNNKVKETYKDYQKDNHFNLKYASDPNMSLGAAMGYGLEVVPIYKFMMNAGATYTFRYTTFPLTNYWIKENSTTTKDYVSVTDYVETTQTNNYSIPAYKHTYPTESITEGSGDILKTTFKYPQDVTASELGSAQFPTVLDALVNNNEIADAVIVKSYKNNVVNSEVKTFFDQYNTNVSGTTMILPKYIYMKKGENAGVEDRKITFNSYDDQGNLTQYTSENGIPVSVIWGYNKTMPIAKIEGAQLGDISSSDINTLVGISDADNNYSASVTAEQTEQDLINALDTFRENMSNYKITTYTYDPLIGVRSITPPSGLREYYNYDIAGRLKEVKRAEKDLSGNEVLRVLKKNEYHYQQP